MPPSPLMTLPSQLLSPLSSKNVTEKNDSKIKKQAQVPSSMVLGRVQTTLGDTNTKEPLKDQGRKNNFHQTTQKLEKKFPQKVDNTRLLSCANLQAEVEALRGRKALKIRSNIASLTKKYALFLFKSAGLNKDKDDFSK